MLLSIITPTICRPSLAKTCESIDQQSYRDYEHIVMVDRPQGPELVEKLSHPNRTWIWCNRAHNDFGNTCRAHACDLAAGDYLAFCDDDDAYAPSAFQIIAAAIEKHTPAWILFPALVYGERWLKQPPGSGVTVSCQFAYRRDLAIRWPDTKEYAADGILVDQLMKVAPPLVLDIPECLAVVDKSRYGAAS